MRKCHSDHVGTVWKTGVSCRDSRAIHPHTLRHAFASTAGDLGYSDATIGAMLGHAGHGVTSRYIHHLDVVLIAAADRVAMQIAGAMSMMEKR